MATILIVLPDPEIVLSDDADVALDIDYPDGSLTGVPLKLTIRADPGYPRKRLVDDNARRELDEDLWNWPAVIETTATTTPAVGFAAAMVVTRAQAALLLPGQWRYVAEISRTDLSNVSPVVVPFWVSVRSAVSR